MELIMTLLIFSLLAGAVTTVLLVSAKQKTATSNEVGSTQMARTAVDMLARDLRTAGFGTDMNHATPQPPIAYVDSLQVLLNTNQTPLPDTSTTKRGWPLAYNPTGNPKPHPLVSSSWTPVAKYRTGAETVRWTLDLNNDGQVDANDLAQTDGSDANRTPNPNDYELCREVYGDSSGAVSGNNGGARERIALVKRPGNGTPPMFKVYLSGDAGPWNWSNGPVPANRLAEIQRIELTVVATSPSKNFLGKYTDAQLTTTVSELRNAPTFQAINYTVSGFVYDDKNKNKVKDGSDVALAGVAVNLGGYLSQTTSSTGFYSFSVPPGTYVLKHDPPANYGTFTTPDSFIVTVGPSVTKSFADTMRAGGWITVTVYNDVDKNASFGGSDKAMEGKAVTLLGAPDLYSTDASGKVVMFAPVGAYSISTTLPDSFVFSTTHPVTGTMTNGATKTGSIGMYIFDSGTVSGTVFSDNDGDGALDNGENGIADAYVSCTLPDATLIYAYTDKKGKYTIRLPVNDPPKTTPFTINCTPPSGYAIGSNMAIENVWVKKSQVISSQNFALGKLAVWEHDLDEPLNALAAGDFIENDWSGGPVKNARKDLDLVMGTDEGTSSRLQQLLNRYEKTPAFDHKPNVSRGIMNSVLALAVDTLDAGSGAVSRPDVVAGIEYRPSANFMVWYTQNGTGNEGLLPTTASQSYVTSDNGDVQAVCTYPGGAGQSPSIIVGTRSPTSGRGVIEVWKSATHTNPTFVQSQILPPTGAIPSNNLGEVTSMALGDFDDDGISDLVVGTRTGSYSGQIMVFELVTGVWTYRWSVTLASDAVTAITVLDVDDDGKDDIVAGTQSGLSDGKLHYYENNVSGGTIQFKSPVKHNPNGIVTSLNHTDLNGDEIDDILVGWRDSATTFLGGLEIWYTTAKTLPSSGTDATGGKINRMVTEIVVGDFNYGVYPTTPTSSLPDIAAVARKDFTHGQIIVLTR